MRATIAWWDLSQSDQTIDSLRDYLADDAIRPWHKVEGLMLKFWVSCRNTNRWGAVMLWESADIIPDKMPPNKATDLIGYAPTTRMASDVEAIIGRVNAAHMVSRGLAFEPIGF